VLGVITVLCIIMQLQISYSVYVPKIMKTIDSRQSYCLKTVCSFFRPPCVYKTTGLQHWDNLQESWAIAKMTARCTLCMGALKIVGSPW